MGMADGSPPARVNLSFPYPWKVWTRKTDFRVVLPIGYTRNSVGWLLDQVFPEDERGRSTVESFLDVAANPDLPEIYAVMLQVAEGMANGPLYPLRFNRWPRQA